MSIDSASESGLGRPATELLPYWLAGRVDDDTHVQAFRFLDQEDDWMREALVAAVADRTAPLSAQESAALLLGDPGPGLRRVLAAKPAASRQDITNWVRQEWRFEPSPSIDDAYERAISATAHDYPSIVGVTATYRLARDGDRTLIYVCVVDSIIRHQDELWHRIDNAVIDLPTVRGERMAKPLFESIRLGWDWPVYYRDMVANSRLIWSASGEDIDLRALAENQPRDD
jgi:hypothetical protein